MGTPPPVHVIAVYNSDAGTADFFKRALDSSGFAAFAAPTDIDGLEAFVGAIRPDAVVFDVANASESQREELLRLSSRTPCRDVPMVITTGERRTLSNPPADQAQTLAATVEMFTHRNDLQDLRSAVRQVVQGAHGGPWRHSRAATRPS